MNNWIKEIEEMEKRMSDLRKPKKKQKFSLAEIVRVFIYAAIVIFIVHIIYKGSTYDKQQIRKDVVERNESELKMSLILKEKQNV
jgi:hypothetical protein